MLFAVTSSALWWTLSPETAVNIVRIMVGLDLRVWVVAGLSERGAVDVGEDVLAHPLARNGRDHGAVADGNDKGCVVDEDDGLTRALGRETVDAVGEPLEAVARDVD